MEDVIALAVYVASITTVGEIYVTAGHMEEEDTAGDVDTTEESMTGDMEAGEMAMVTTEAAMETADTMRENMVT